MYVLIAEVPCRLVPVPVRTIIGDVGDASGMKSQFLGIKIEPYHNQITDFTTMFAYLSEPIITIQGNIDVSWRLISLFT